MPPPALDQLVSRRALGDADLDALQIGGPRDPANVIGELTEAATRHDGRRADVHLLAGLLVQPLGEPLVENHVGPLEIAEEVRQVDHVEDATERTDVLRRGCRDLDQILLHLLDALVLDADGARTIKLDIRFTLRILLDTGDEVVKKRDSEARRRTLHGAEDELLLGNGAAAGGQHGRTGKCDQSFSQHAVLPPSWSGASQSSSCDRALVNGASQRSTKPIAGVLLYYS